MYFFAAVRTAALTAALCIVGFALCTSAAYAQNDINITGNQTFTIKNGDRYGLVTVADTSTVNMIGGMVNELDTFTSSKLNLSAGSIGFVVAQNNSVVSVSGGTLGALFGADSSTLNVSGGTISNLDYDNFTTGTTTGGTIPLLTIVDGDVSITGGNLNRILSFGLGTTTITGFNFALTGVTAGTTSTTNYLYQGTYFTLTGRLQNNSVAATYTLFDAYSRTRTTTGVTTITTGRFVLNDLATGKTTTLAAAAPEPGSLSLMGLSLVSGTGSFGLVRRLRTPKGSRRG